MLVGNQSSMAEGWLEEVETECRSSRRSKVRERAVKAAAWVGKQSPRKRFKEEILSIFMAEDEIKPLSEDIEIASKKWNQQIWEADKEI